MSLKDVTGFLTKNSPTILTIVAAIGAVGTVVLAVKATPRAQDHIFDAEEEVGDRLTPKETFQACWKDYIPTAISGGLTLACIFGARYCSYRQQEVLATGYLIAHSTLQEYERVMTERIGENKMKAVREEVKANIAERQSPRDDFSTIRKSDAVYTGHGNTLFYDVGDDRYFYSDIQYLEHSTNKINEQLFVGHEPYFDENEIRLEWGLPMKKGGSEWVVTPEHPLLIHIDPDPMRMENGDVRILFDYEMYPKVQVLGR